MQRLPRAARALAIIPFLALAAWTLAAPAGAQAPMTITVNGSDVNLNPPPLERSGRVFVPLRGVFEMLGATVVYDNGLITATAHDRRMVSLRVGSQDATVGGQPETIDVAPFIVGASTFVPLRFVSEALGAQVSYNPTDQSVAIVTRSGGVRVYGPHPPVGSDVSLLSRYPRDGAFVDSMRPRIQADFSAPIDPDSLRITIDGMDVTDRASISRTGFVYRPRSPLESTEHHVRVTGRDADGNRIDRSWNFTTSG